MENNTSSQVPEENEILGATVTWIYLSIRTLQGLVAVTGNLITLLVVYKYEELWESSTSRLVASLALADLFGGVGPFCALARNIKIFSTKTTMLNIICILNIFVNLVASIGNAYNILLITIDRYIYLTRPLKYFSIVTRDRVMVAILIGWTCVLSESIFLLAIGSNINAKVTCIMSATISKPGMVCLTLKLVITTFFIIAPMYGRIFYTAYKLNKTEPDFCHYPSESQNEQLEKVQERRMIMTVGLVLGTYIICYLPTTTYNAIVTMVYTPPFPFAILLGNRILRVVYKMQCLLNPFIYGWKNYKFRKAYQRLLCRKTQVVPNNLS